MADEAKERVQRLRERKARTLEGFDVEEVEGLEEKRSEVAQALSDAKAQARLEEEKDRDDRREALRDEKRRLADASEDIETLDAVQEQLDYTRAEQEAVTETEEALNEVEGAIDRLRSQVETIREGLPDGVTSSDALAERRDEVDAELAALEEALEDAEAALQAAKETVAEKSQSARDRQYRAQQVAETVGDAKQRFRSALEDSDFPDVAAFEEARLDDAAQEALGEKVQAFEEEWAAATDRLERAEAEAEDVEAPDVEEAEETVDSVEANLNEQREAVTERTLELESIDEALMEIEEIREDLATADERFETIGFLSETARGDNDLRMSLQRFALATRLEEVLRVANEHIAHMTALSLALGLSDVVQSVSGGRHLETLFIDEGFGSLDQEALDRAMEELSKLRDTGRLVGVISHVSELKQRIATRLEVEQTQEGSSLSMTA